MSIEELERYEALLRWNYFDEYKERSILTDEQIKILAIFCYSCIIMDILTDSLKEGESK